MGYEVIWAINWVQFWQQELAASVNGSSTNTLYCNIHIKHSFVILILVLTVVLTVEWKPLSTLQNLLYTRQQQKLTTIITKSLLVTLINIHRPTVRAACFNAHRIWNHLHPVRIRQEPSPPSLTPSGTSSPSSPPSPPSPPSPSSHYTPPGPGQNLARSKQPIIISLEIIW